MSWLGLVIVAPVVIEARGEITVVGLLNAGNICQELLVRKWRECDCYLLCIDCFLWFDGYGI